MKNGIASSQTNNNMNDQQISQDKIKIARELNTRYNIFCAEREEHKKKRDEILKTCEAEGISTDLIQVTPEIFNFLIGRKVVKQYFK